jgi:hypothetical protein
MEQVNGGRVALGGLLAGLVMNVGHALAEGVGMRAEMEGTLARLGLPPLSEATMITMAGGAFVIGLIAVWTYAAIRPRYGAGARAALRAASAVWVLACLFPHASLLACGVIGPKLFALSVGADLVFVPLGTLAGARIYREVEGSDERSRSGAAHAHA